MVVPPCRNWNIWVDFSPDIPLTPILNLEK